MPQISYQFSIKEKKAKGRFTFLVTRWLITFPFNTFEEKLIESSIIMVNLLIFAKGLKGTEFDFLLHCKYLGWYCERKRQDKLKLKSIKFIISHIERGTKTQSRNDLCDNHDTKTHGCNVWFVFHCTPYLI